MQHMRDTFPKSEVLAVLETKFGGVIAEMCRAHGISRPTGYKALKLGVWPAKVIKAAGKAAPVTPAEAPASLPSD